VSGASSRAEASMSLAGAAVRWLLEVCLLVGTPATLLVARIIEEPLAAPAPTHPVGHGPLRPPLLDHRVCALRCPRCIWRLYVVQTSPIRRATIAAVGRSTTVARVPSRCASRGTSLRGTCAGHTPPLRVVT